MNLFLSLQQFANNSLRGMQNYYIEIIIVVLVGIYLILFYEMNQLRQEGMTPKNLNNMCDLSSDELNEKCKTLNSNNCNLTRCCIYLSNNNKGRCVAGNRNGPTFIDEIETPTMKADHFYFRNERYSI